MTQGAMLNKLLDSESHLLTHAEKQLLNIWDLKDRPLDKRDLEKLVDMYDRVFVYGVE